jgi:hypothetical protein
MAGPHWVGVVNLSLAAVALAVLVATVAVMASVPVPHWQSGTVDWTVHYETCDAGLCPVQQAELQIPNGTSAYLHWTWTGAPAPIQFWLVSARGLPVFYSNTTQAPFEYTAVDGPYELLLVVPQPLTGPTTLELNYSYEQSHLLL